MNTDNFSTVAIVGAGPFGLKLAMALTLRGVEGSVFGPGAPDLPAHPKCNTRGGRSMEVLRFPGCQDAHALCGLPTSYPSDVACSGKPAQVLNHIFRIPLVKHVWKQAPGSLTPQSPHKSLEATARPPAAEHDEGA